ncbi:MAG TPA: thioredoxin domain-containing protein [Streptosporangiaceae bacterium]|nr:thioredoxin domain-containing protein [Streptosporangiaceae bacterium]
MAERLRNATSPYLLQHADNPVDWWPWGDEAFAAARERGVPVLLSVGYSACHWCHVMAHESFEDEATAALMNENLVSIKVDREERPDVDAVYMTATQAMTGQGGWPMTVFMTPDREPFYCGTYFPREPFQRLVGGVADAWRKDQGAVTGQAKRIAGALAEQMSGGGHGGRPAPGALAESVEAAVTGLQGSYDARLGGFGGAPKFPPSMVLEFLLRHRERDGGPSGESALRMAADTMEAMARGGIYDQLAGGFARYSVDAGWVVPHFEKMLYDNALLARVYAHWWRRSGSPLARRVAADTCAWMLAELGTAEGGFASALDADSEGEEGRFYVWTPAQLREVLGPADGQYAAEVFGVTGDGTFERGSSVLQLPADPADAERFEGIQAALLAAREQRVRPGRDDKVVAAWNGLAIAALAEAGLLLERPGFVEAATAAAELLARTHLSGGRLLRTSRDGVPGTGAGVLEDYASVAEGFLALSGVTGEGRWVGLAGELLETALDRFGDQNGGFFDTADDGERLIYRPADPADGPTPSGTFAVAGALLSYAALTGSARHREAAAGALGPLPAVASRYPRAAGWGLAVAEAMASGPAEIAVVGPPGDERTDSLHRMALYAAPPGAVIALGTFGGGQDDGGQADGAAAVPLLAGREPVNGAAAAYVCRDFTCRLPVTDPEQLRAELAAAGGPANSPS